jgi:hypothetical protein
LSISNPYLNCVAWTGSQVITVGNYGALLTHPDFEYPTRAIGHLPDGSGRLSLRMDGSYLFAGLPKSLSGKPVRASICSLNGTTVMHATPEELHSEGLSARGPNFDPGTRLAPISSSEIQCDDDDWLFVTEIIKNIAGCAQTPSMAAYAYLRWGMRNLDRGGMPVRAPAAAGIRWRAGGRGR